MSPLIQRGRRWLVPMLAIVILIGGFVGVALSQGGSSNTQAPTQNRDQVRWLEYFADELGVGQEELLSAAQGATERTLDDLVAQRLLTQAQASTIRSRLRAAIQNPDALRRILGSLRQEAAPYRTLVEDVKADVERAVAGELGVDRSRLESLARSGRLERSLRRSGVTRTELSSTVRRAAAPALRDAVRDGLITRRQARFALAKIDAFLEHHR